METIRQPALDRFNRGEIDFEQLAEATDWGRRWKNYAQYRSILEAARRLDIPVLALNARAETIREVFRSGGMDKLAPEMRKELPRDVQLKDPDYERLLRVQMMVHASVEEGMLRSMVEAQIARDEAMAAALVDYLQSPAGQGRTACSPVRGGACGLWARDGCSRRSRTLPGIRQRHRAHVGKRGCRAFTGRKGDGTRHRDLARATATDRSPDRRLPTRAGGSHCFWSAKFRPIEKEKRSMRAAVIPRYGPPDVLEIRDVARPDVCPGRVLIRVRAAGINPLDWRIRSGSLRLLLPAEIACDSRLRCLRRRGRGGRGSDAVPTWR